MPLNKVPVCFWQCASSNLPSPTASGSEIDPITGNGIALQDKAKVWLHLQSESEATAVLEQPQTQLKSKTLPWSLAMPFHLVLRFAEPANSIECQEQQQGALQMSSSCAFLLDSSLMCKHSWWPLDELSMPSILAACINKCTCAAFVTHLAVLTPVVSFHSFSCASEQESVC